MKKLHIYYIFFFLFIFLISCSKGLKEKELRILIAPDYYPFAYTENDTLRGLEIELLNLLNKRLKVDLKVNQYPFDVLLETFNSEEYDIAIGAITVTEKRSEIFDFSISYYNASQTILTNLKSVGNLDSLDILSKNRLGVIDHSTSLLYLENSLVKERRISANNIRRYSNLTNLINGLLNNEVQYILLENSIAELVKETYDFYIVFVDDIEENYSFALQKKSPILKFVNRDLEKIINSDEWHKIKLKYLIND